MSLTFTFQYSINLGRFSNPLINSKHEISKLGLLQMYIYLEIMWAIFLCP
jgi:hypothetical protein